MANEENLKPVRTKSEARELGRRGGKASGVARRRKAALRETMNQLLTMQMEVDNLSDVLRADGMESTYEAVVAMAMIQKASQGDVKAYQAIMQTVGQTGKSEADLEEQKIRTERAKRARDQEVGVDDEDDDNIRSFLRAMNPTEQDMEDLFKAGEEDDEEAEETDTV